MHQPSQHSHRTLYCAAAAFLLIIVALAWPFVRRYYIQRAFIADVKDFGGMVVMEPGGPAWLRDRLPGDLALCVDTPRVVHLENSPVDDAWLANLREHPTIEHLGLAATDITDAGAAHVHDMPHLRVLWLSGTNITDAGLSALDRLQE